MMMGGSLGYKGDDILAWEWMRKQITATSQLSEDR